jgi:hypothetical protein
VPSTLLLLRWQAHCVARHSCAKMLDRQQRCCVHSARSHHALCTCCITVSPLCLSGMLSVRIVRRASWTPATLSTSATGHSATSSSSGGIRQGRRTVDEVGGCEHQRQVAWGMVWSAVCTPPRRAPGHFLQVPPGGIHSRQQYCFCCGPLPGTVRHLHSQCLVCLLGAVVCCVVLSVLGRCQH